MQVRHRTRKTRKPKGFRATQPGQCVGFDSIERSRDGLRRYLVSAQDERPRSICGTQGSPRPRET